MTTLPVGGWCRRETEKDVRNRLAAGGAARPSRVQDVGAHSKVTRLEIDRDRKAVRFWFAADGDGVVVGVQ